MKRNVEVTTTVLFYAFRYALGRKTGAPSTISTSIVSNINEFAEWELIQIVKEILEYEDYSGSLGDDCDKEVWYKLVDTINDKLKQ
jgi:hypothetical protein